MSLSPRLLLGSLDLTDAPFALEFGADYGSPQDVVDTIASLLADGEIESLTRRSNRTMVIPVLIEGSDLAELADAEAALIAECDKEQNTLTLDPGDGFAAATVFTTFAASPQQMYDDTHEIATIRRYKLTVRARPFGHSESATVIGSAFVADSESIADDCESTSGWSITHVGATGSSTVVLNAPAVDSSVFSTGTGSVRFSSASSVSPASGGSAAVAARVAKTGLSIDASGGGYFVVRIRSEWTMYLDAANLDAHLTTSGGGREAVSPLAIEAKDGGFLRLSFLVPNNSTITAFDFLARRHDDTGTTLTYPSLWVDSIGLTDGATDNQAARTMTIGGSARSEGSFEISAAVGLGDVVLYTCPDLGDGFRPDLRRWTSAGTPTVDTAAINGSYIPANTGEFEAPANIYRSGAYAVLARVRSTGGTTFDLNIDARTVLGGTDIGQTYTVESGTITVADTTGYHVVRIGVLDLPPHKVAAAADAVIRFVLDGPSTVRVDEVMVFPLEDAALTWLECGSGAPSAVVSSRVWIDGASSSQPYGQILVGNDADRADAQYVRPKSKGRHLLYPGQMLAYLLTSAAGGAEMATTYFKHWHTWAAEDG